MSLLFTVTSTDPACQVRIYSDYYAREHVTPAALAQVNVCALRNAHQMIKQPGQQLVECELEYSNERDGTVILRWLIGYVEVTAGEGGGLTLPADSAPTPVPMNNPPPAMEANYGKVEVENVVSSSLVAGDRHQLYLKEEFVHALYSQLEGIEKLHRALLREVNLRTDNNPDFDPYEASLIRMRRVWNKTAITSNRQSREDVDGSVETPGGTGAEQEEAS
jgi:hypothetical protein